MAESNDRKNSLSITDDMIKEALKAGLSSVKASDYLIKSTLEKCRAEIAEDKQKKKTRFFTPVFYKLGVPLAAGVLILVLIINGPRIMPIKMSENYAQPQASSLEGTAAFESRNSEGAYSMDSSAAAPRAMPEPEQKAKDRDSADESSAGLTVMHFGESLSVLNSSVHRTTNSNEPGLDESIEYFNAITRQYNSNNKTELILEKENVRRIYTLPEEGVSAATLLNAGDYHEILSGEGYWALPLKNNDGNFEIILTAAAYKANDHEKTLSNHDAVYSVGKESFIVSSFHNSTFIGAELNALFDFDAFFGMISEMGYEYGNDAEMIIADINYGADFIVMLGTGGEKYVIPFLTNEVLFGIENKRVYTWPEFVGIVSVNMGQ